MDFGRYVDERTTMMIAVVLLSALAGILFMGLLAPLVTSFTMGADVRLEPGYFNARTIVPTALIFLTLITCLMLRYIDPQRVAYGVGALVLVSVVSFAVSPFGNRYVDLAMPIGVFGLGAVSYRIVCHARAGTSSRAKARVISPQLIHLGAVLILLGLVITSSMTTETMVGDQRAGLRFTEGGSQSIGDYTVKVVGFDRYYAGEPFRMNEGSQIVQEAQFEVYKDGRLVDTGSVKQLYDFRWEQFYTTNYVKRFLGEEFFVSPANPTYVDSEGRTATFYMRIVPGMNLLWAGTVLMAAGMLSTAYLDLTGPVARVEKPRSKRKADKYEEMLRNELEARKKRSTPQPAKAASVKKSSESLSAVGVDRSSRKKLEREGINNTARLREADPRELSEKTGIPEETIRSWINKDRD